MDERAWRDHFNRTARSYDWKERLWGLLLGYSDDRSRRELVGRLELKAGQRVLEVSTGTGTNLLLAAGDLGPGGSMVGADISVEMLRLCRGKLARYRHRADVVVSDAARLPFASDSFDAVLHFGAVSMFSDKKAAIDEMVRVARPGARLVIGDVGLLPAKRQSVRSRLVLRVNGRYAEKPPLELIRPHAANLSLTWFRNGTCYLINFTKAGEEARS